MLKNIKEIGKIETDAIKISDCAVEIEIDLPIEDMNTEMAAQVEQWKEWYKNAHPKAKDIQTEFRICYNYGKWISNNFIIKMQIRHDCIEKPNADLYVKSVSFSDENMTLIKQKMKNAILKYLIKIL